MHFVPILSTLRRHKTAATLVVLEIALTCAIVSNAVFLIGNRLDRMHKASGVAESELVDFRIAGIGVKQNEMAQTTTDIAALRAIPGVKFVASTNMVPLGGSSWNNTVRTTPEMTAEGTNAALYVGTDDLVETLGVKLVAGRDFTPDEYQDFDAVIIDLCTTHRGADEATYLDKPPGTPPRILVSTVFTRAECSFADQLEAGNAARLADWTHRPEQ